MSIFINKEMRALIPPLSEEELDQLEANVVAEGIRDPLVTWPQPDGREMLIDGHNRFDISCRHNGIPFKVVRKEFTDMDEAKVWVIRNQFGRRNLSAYDRSVLALKLKPLIAEREKERMVNAPQKKAEREKEINKIWREHDFDTARVLVAQKRQEFGREDRTPQMAGEKCIYFARFGDNQLKIGSSVYPEDRVKQLSVSCPGIKLVEAIHYGAGAEKHENAIKRKYGQYRIGNECYQCSDEILSEMIAFTKKEAARKSNTDYELAKIAGVSHDTIHRVEAIEKEAREDTKQLIREGKLSINQAYNAIHPPKSPRQSMKEFMDQKKQEHEDFKEKKTVSINDIQKDRETTELIVTDLYTRLLRMGKRIDEICFDMEAGDIDLKELGRTLPKDKADFLQITIRDTRNKLLKIEMEVYGDR